MVSEFSEEISSSANLVDAVAAAGHGRVLVLPLF